MHLFETALFASLALVAIASISILPRTDQALIGALYLPSGNYSSNAFVEARQQTYEAITRAIRTGKSQYGQMDSQETSFSISVFSAISNRSLFTYHFEAPKLNGSYTKGQLSDNTIYRTGSLGKVLTVYEFLVDIGDKVFLEPITRFIPELATASRTQPKNPILYTDWNEVTIGSLASQISGIGRDYKIGDLAFGGIDTPPPEMLLQNGYPPVDSRALVNCSFYDYSRPSCNREEFLNGVITHPPSFPSYTKAAYSNIAFALLGMVYENATGRSLAKGFEELYRRKLDMQSTFSYEPGPHADAVIPYNDTWAVFSYQIGLYWPAGGQYTSTKDLQTLGQAILRSTQLPPVVTRRWLKPTSTTSQWASDIGAPWEIYRLPIVSDSTYNLTRIVDVYSKGGDVGKYSTVFGLGPDHEIGFSILCAGAAANTQAQTLKSLISEAFIQAAEAAAKEKAKHAFAGTFEARDRNSSIVLEVEDSGPGVRIKNWLSNGTDFMNSELQKVPDTRIFPAQLSHMHNDTTFHAFRAIFAEARAPDTSGDLWPEITDNWYSVDGGRYDNLATDAFIIGMDSDGVVQSVHVDALKVTMYRT